jgi:hypothetical protein
MSASSSSRPSGSDPADRLELAVALEPDADAAELEDAAGTLRDELLGLDVDAVDRLAAGEPPPGARAGEATVLAGLAVQIGQATLPLVLGAIQAWVGQRASRTVKVTVDGDSIEVSNASPDDQHQLIEAFIARHEGPAG